MFVLIVKHVYIRLNSKKISNFKNMYDSNKKATVSIKKLFKDYYIYYF